MISVMVQGVPPVEQASGVLISKALSEPPPVTKTLPDESVAIPNALLSVFPVLSLSSFL